MMHTEQEHSLDLALSAIYQHGSECFPEKSDVIRQPVTAGYQHWVQIMPHSFSTGALSVERAEVGNKENEDHAVKSKKRRQENPPKKWEPGHRVHPSHPVRLGGLQERRHVASVKLGISVDHSPLSQNGYSRNSYGAFYTS